MALLREDQCDRKGKREEEVARNRMRSEPGVIEGGCGVDQRERVLRPGRVLGKSFRAGAAPGWLHSALAQLR